MPSVDGYDSFDDDLVFEAKENVPAEDDSGKATDVVASVASTGGNHTPSKDVGSRKRGPAILASSQRENLSSDDSFDRSLEFEGASPKRARISPVKRSPKLFLPEKLKVIDSGVPGFPALFDESLQFDLLVSTVSTSPEGDIHTVCQERKMDGATGDEYVVHIQGIWTECDIRAGSSLRVIGPRIGKDKFELFVDSTDGVLIVAADSLVSCTTVVQSFFCPRKAVLGDRLRGNCGGNKAMLTGIIIHELFQAALLTPPTVKLTSEWLLSRWRETILDEMLVSLCALNYTPEQFECELQPYVEVIIDWIEGHMPERIGQKKPVHTGYMVEKVQDIEENVWMPLLGLKGKVDVNLKCRKGDDSVVLPLELKTGKSGMSSDHAGQVLMYIMMLSNRYRSPMSDGSLLYLKDGTSRPVKPKSAELKGILSRRNNIATYVISAEEVNNRLPAPRADPHFCHKCDFASACTLFGKAFPVESAPCTSDESLAFQLQYTEHLSPSDIQYFRKWAEWIDLELREELRNRVTASNIWRVSATKRAEAYDCMANLRVLDCVEQTSGRFLVTFQSNTWPIFVNGDYVIVSSDRIPAVDVGSVIGVDGKKLTMSLERSLSMECVYHLDRHASITTYGINLTNVVLLMGNEERLARLRSLIVDLTEPNVVKLTAGELAKIKPLVQDLNDGQRRAVAKTLVAGSFSLIEGLPGTGKTTMLVALIRAFVALGHTVLVTAYTHSAVDNLLGKLVKYLAPSDLLRLGRRSSIRPDLLHLTIEHRLEGVRPEDRYGRTKEMLDRTPVVLCSCLSVSTHTLFAHRRFSFCVVDESSMVVESALLGPLLVSDKFVLVGDAKQLSPLVSNQKAKNEGMAISLFERLLVHDKHTVSLSQQFRMNSVISRLSSELFYGGRLKCATEAVGRACLDTVYEGYREKCGELSSGTLRTVLSGVLADAALFVDARADAASDAKTPVGVIACSSGSITNEPEAALIAVFCRKLVELGVPAAEIGVMCIYRKQIEIIRNHLDALCDIEVNTVDQYQGKDKSVILCSLTWTMQHGRKRSELLSDERRLNVALTRAKHKLIVVGCARSMREKCPVVAKVIEKLPVQSAEEIIVE